MDVRTPAHDFSIAKASTRFKEASSILSAPMQWKLYVVALLLSDVMMSLAALWLAYDLRFRWLIQYFDPNATVSFEAYRLLLYAMPCLWLAIFAANGLYSKRNLLGGTREYANVFRSASEGFLLVVIAGFLSPTLIIARGWLLMTWGGTFLFVAAARFLLRRAVYALRSQGFFLTPAIIVGANQEGRWLAEQLLQWSTSGLHLLGFVDKKLPVDEPSFYGLACLGSVDSLGEIIEQYDIGEIILASSAISSRDHLLDIFRRYGVDGRVNIRMSSGLYEILTTSLTVNEYAYVPLLQVNKVRLTGVDSVMKAILDYFLAITSLIILFPVLLAVALLVKTSSPGPILHRRLVMGLNGRKFYALKFRTMVVRGDRILEQYPGLTEELRQNHKLRKDPRITSIGAVLRKYSLDELPQLLNVLKRDMSMVGPRMISPEETSLYKQFDMNLLTVLPGITGLWQVSGRSDISYEERVRLDMYYIRNWSIWLDLQLLFQTIPAVLGSRGAY